MDRELRPRERPKDRDQREAKSSRSDRPSRSRERPSERPRERPEDRKQKGTAKSSETDRPSRSRERPRERPRKRSEDRDQRKDMSSRSDQSQHSRGSPEELEDRYEGESRSSKSDRYERANKDKLVYRPKPPSPHGPYSESPGELERRNRDRRMSSSDYPVHRSSTDVTFLDAKSLTMSALPKLGYIDNRATQSSAIHSHLTFCANMIPWTSFEHEVRSNFNQIFRDWDQKPKVILSVELKQPPANAITNEHYLCGEELSSSGRYVQNVLHVMTAVGKELAIGLQFGDWYASHKYPTQSSTSQTTSGATGNQPEKEDNEEKGKRLIPDYALLAEKEDPKTNSFARALGEAKSPSPKAHNLASWVDLANQGTQKEGKLRKLLGQVANYMWMFRLKYAFVTNYTTTIFLKWDEDRHTKKPSLYYSRPIMWEHCSILEQDRQTSDRSSYPQVSVRECMLYFQSLVVSGDWRSKIDCPSEAWVKESPRKTESESKDKARRKDSRKDKDTRSGDSRGNKNKPPHGRGERRR